MKKISIIVPVYNAEKYLEKCVQSILDQTHSCLEVILVNDGSKDGSLALCNALAERDGRIRVVDKPNGGAASARNAGIRKASGDYIGFCDSDDFLDVDMMATMLDVMENEGLNTLECTARVLDTAGNVLNEDDDSEMLVKRDLSSAINEIFFRRGNVHLATRLTKAEFIRELSIPEGRRVEDFYFTIALLMRTGGTAVLNKPFYNYVMSEGSVTRSPGGSIYLDALYFYDKSLELVKDAGIDVAEAAEYYRYKMYYLLAISARKSERVAFKKEIARCKADLKSSFDRVKACAHLKRKEKLVLGLAKISFGLARLAYVAKGGK